jgi:hypothetical protein
MAALPIVSPKTTSSCCSVIDWFTIEDMRSTDRSVVPPPASQTSRMSFSRKMPGASVETWTAAASASVRPMVTLWVGCVPKPERETIVLKDSTVGRTGQVVGTLKMNSMRALGQSVPGGKSRVS